MAKKQGTAATTNLVSLKDRIRRRVDSIRNTFTGMGDDKVFAGRPDLYRQILTWQELTQLWRFNGLARRYVEIVPNDATRKGWNVVGDDGEVEGIDGENQRLDVFAAFNQADTWGRLYGGAWLLIVTTDRVPANVRGGPGYQGPLAEPLDPARLVSVDNLAVLDVTEAVPVEYDTRLRSSTFREPLRYMLSWATGSPDGLQSGTVVHASRLLYFPGQRLPPSQRYANGGIDDSILQSVWDQIRNSGQLEHALAVIANELRISTLKMKDLADLELNDEAAYFDYRMREMSKHKSALNTVLLGADEEYTHQSGTVAGMAELTATTRQALQAVTGMPEQLWIGNAPGGLSTDGESHRNLWAQVISSYQVTKYQPLLVYLYELILSAQQGPTGGVVPEVWSVDFEPLDELTVKGKADLKKVTADTDAIYLDRGVLTAEQVAEGRFGAGGWKEQLPSAETLEPAPGLNMAAIEAALAQGEGAPAGGEAATAPVDVAKQAMNGAQAASLQGMIEAAAIGELPVGALGPMIRSAFQALVPPDEVAAIESAVRAELGQPEPQVDPVTGEAVPPPVDTEDDETEAQPSHAEALAQHLTELQVERCEHGSLNRCLKCGIERDRRVKVGPDGQALRDEEGMAIWELRWRPIEDAPKRRVYGDTPTESPRRLGDAADPRLRFAPRGTGRTDEVEPNSVWIGLPLPEEALGAYESARVEAAIRAGMAPQDLRTNGKPPHVTVLWLGKLGTDEAQAMAEKATAALDSLLGGRPLFTAGLRGSESAAQHAPLQLTGIGLGAFAPSPSSKGETVLYQGFTSQALDSLHRELVNALLTPEEIATRPWFVPHATLGFRPGEMPADQWGAIWDYRGARETWEARVVELHVGDVVTRWVLGAR